MPCGCIVGPSRHRAQFSDDHFATRAPTSEANRIISRRAGDECHARPQVGSTLSGAVVTMRVIQAVAFLAFLAVVGVFAAQNTQVVTVHFLSWNIETPTAI